MSAFHPLRTLPKTLSYRPSIMPWLSRLFLIAGRIVETGANHAAATMLVTVNIGNIRAKTAERFRPAVSSPPVNSFVKRPPLAGS